MLFILIIVPIAHANQITKTKLQLAQLTTKIHTLEKKLNHAQNTQNILQNELKNTQQKITLYKNKCQEIQQQLTNKQQNITKLEQEITITSSKLQRLQNSLSKYLVTQYKLTNQQQINNLLSQNNIFTLNKLLMYNQYVINAHKKIILDIQNNQKLLATNKQKLQEDLQELAQLKIIWQKNTTQLNSSLTYHNIVLKKLNSDIT